MTSSAQNWLRTNWFMAVVPPLLLVEWLVVRDIGGEMGLLLEAVVLSDLCLFMPLLYVLCYLRSLPPGQLMLRVLGLVCLGVYLATYLVPAPLQQVLPRLGTVRIAGLAVLVLVELRLMMAALWAVWGRNGDVAQVRAASGAPEWIARLIVLEARFWKRVWKLLRRR